MTEQAIIQFMEDDCKLTFMCIHVYEAQDQGDWLADRSVQILFSPGPKFLLLMDCIRVSKIWMSRKTIDLSLRIPFFALFVFVKAIFIHSKVFPC